MLDKLGYEGQLTLHTHTDKVANTNRYSREAGTTQNSAHAPAIGINTGSAVVTIWTTKSKFESDSYFLFLIFPAVQ